jgi:CRISPR/Cas system-associated endoribonuclease Cas2
MNFGKLPERVNAVKKIHQDYPQYISRSIFEKLNPDSLENGNLNKFLRDINVIIDNKLDTL